MSALARAFLPQCLLPGAQVRSTAGMIDVKDIGKGCTLESTNGGVLIVRNCFEVLARERDIVRVELEDGHFEVTSDHFVEASRGHTWYPWQVSELKEGMFIRTEDGQSEIIGIEPHPRQHVAVYKLELVENGTVWLDAKDVFVSIFGGEPELSENELRDLVYLQPPRNFHPDPSRPRSDPCGDRIFASVDPGNVELAIPSPSVGSAGHPECAGACNHMKKFGRCKYGDACQDCHIIGCRTRLKRKIGKRQRDKAKKFAAAASESMDPVN